MQVSKNSKCPFCVYNNTTVNIIKPLYPIREFHIYRRLIAVCRKLYESCIITLMKNVSPFWKSLVDCYYSSIYMSLAAGWDLDLLSPVPKGTMAIAIIYSRYAERHTVEITMQVLTLMVPSSDCGRANSVIYFFNHSG